MNRPLYVLGAAALLSLVVGCADSSPPPTQDTPEKLETDGAKKPERDEKDTKRAIAEALTKSLRDKGGIQPEKGKEAKRPDKGTKEPEKGKEWIDATKGVWEENGVRVKVVSVAIEFAKGTESGFNRKTAFTSKEKCLIVRLRTENKNDTKKIDYHPFGGWTSFGDDAEELTDNFGNRYKEMTFSDVTLDGRAAAHSLYPDKSVDDVMAFETPIEKAKTLYLELKARSIGTKAPPRFQIPVTMIKK